MVFCIIFLFQYSIAAIKPNFTGTWKLDKSKSVLSGGMKQNQAGIKQSIMFNVNGDTLTFTTKTTGAPMGDLETIETYMIDGKEREFITRERVGSRNSKGKRTAKWLADSSGFEMSEVITREMQGGTFTARNSHKWSLSADGKTLTIETAMYGPQGEIYTKRVFTKQ